MHANFMTCVLTTADKVKAEGVTPFDMLQMAQEIANLRLRRRAADNGSVPVVKLRFRGLR
jgi:hypothetical protein